MLLVGWAHEVGQRGQVPPRLRSLTEIAVIIGPMPAVVLLLPKSGYRNEDFLAAAEKLGVSVIPASDVCHRLADTWDEAPLALRFRDAGAAADELVQEVGDRKPVAVIGV